jgi:hypothetical protein
MRTIKTYSKRAPFYNALIRHVADVVTWWKPSMQYKVFSIPDQKIATSLGGVKCNSFVFSAVVGGGIAV